MLSGRILTGTWANCFYIVRSLANLAVSRELLQFSEQCTVLDKVVRIFILVAFEVLSPEARLLLELVVKARAWAEPICWKSVKFFDSP